MAQLQLSAPWILLYRKIDAMFKLDNDIKVIFEDLDAAKKIKIYVEDPNKADALKKILIPEVQFGTMPVSIEIISVDSDRSRRYTRRRVMTDPNDAADIFIAAFSSNRAFAYANKIEGIFTNPIYYVVFDKVVVQYFTDDIGDVNGICSTLYQEIAKDIFKPFDGVHYCTDTVDHRVSGECVCDF